MSFTDHDPSSTSPADPSHVTASDAPQPISLRPTRSDHTEMPPLFAVLAKLAPDPTVVVDASGRIQLVNHQVEELFGYSSDELLDQPVELLIPERLRTVHQQHRAEYARAPRVRPMDAHLPLFGRRWDGSEFPLEASLGPVEEHGESLVIISIRDISERRQAYTALESANRDLRALQAVTDTALTHLALEDLLAALLERTTSIMHVDNAAVLLLDAAGQTLAVQAVRGLEEPVADRVHVPMGQGFVGRIAATREPLVVDDIATVPVANPFLREQLLSAVGVPLEVGDQLLGVIHVGTVGPRHFTPHDVRLLQQVADRMALAIDRARVYAREQNAREIAEAAQHQAEVAQKEAELQGAQLAAIFEAMADGVVVFDSEGRLLRQNSAQQRLLGIDSAPLGFADLTLPQRMALFAAQDEQGRPLGLNEGPLPRALRGEVFGGAETMDIRSRTLDGREVELSVSAAPLRDKNGLLTGVVGIFRDQTERKRLERGRAEQAEQLETVMEAVPDPLIVYDTDGRVVIANAAYHTLVARLIPQTPLAETVRERVQQLGGFYALDGTMLEEEEWAQTRALRGEVLAGSDAVEFMLHASEGDLLSFSMTAAPLRDLAGHITGAVGMSRDITAYKRLERERAEAQASELAALEVARHMDAFFAAASHDIRTPVTVVSIFVELALRRAQQLADDLAARSPTNPVAAETVEQMVSTVVDKLHYAREGVDQMQSLADYLFDVARARSGMLVVELVPCDLAELVRANVTMQQAVGTERRIDLVVPNVKVPVVADADRLGQVLGNYLTNALKYSPVDQPVTVKLEVEENLATVSVVDHGPGLAVEEQSHVWELFHRVPGVEAQPESSFLGGSLGLGLHICKQLIELHPGGRVGVESMVGEGSTFWFRLPLASSS